MEIYKYSLTAKIVYRFGNIIATLMLSVHLIFSIIILFEKWYYIFPVIINFGIIYAINRFYFKTYKSFPFRIEADNEKIVCKEFFTGGKEIIIKYEDIDELRGGLFSGYSTRPVYIHDKTQNLTIGFYLHVGNFKTLLTKILQNIPQEVYGEVIRKLKNSGDGNK